MEKLELKHIVGYLPYGLKLKKTNQTVLLRGINDNAAIGGLELTYWINPKLSHLDIWQSGEVRNFVLYYAGFLQFKPILRPLSDLTKEIEVNGEKFTPIIELLKIKYKSYYDEKLGSRYSLIEIKNCPNYAEAYFEYHATFSIQVWHNSLPKESYWVIEKLNEWHFDIHGLIEAGLAIDINTLK